MNALQKKVTEKLSPDAVNAAFFTACLSEMIIGYYYTYSNEAKEKIKKITIDDFKVEANRQKRRAIEKKLEKEKELLLNSYTKFETSVTTFLRVLDTLDEKTRETVDAIQNQIFEQLNPMKK